MDDAPVGVGGASGQLSADPEVAGIVAEFAADAHVHRRLDDGSVIHLDRALPFVLVYRQRGDDPGTATLPSTEACYLVVAEGQAAEERAALLLRALTDAAVARFGAFLVLELWSEREVAPAFRVCAPSKEGASTVRTLREALERLSLPSPPDVRVDHEAPRHPPDRIPLVDVRTAWEHGCLVLGLAVPPLYRDDNGDVFPVFLRRFRAALSRALRQAVHDFTRVQTSAGVESFRALGPRRVDELVWRADAELAQLESLFDFLLLVAPMDADAAWDRFRDSRFDRPPEFHYRLLPIDPDLLKRRLFAVELERVEDPTLAQLLRDKRDELDHQLSLLALRGWSDFRLGSTQLYGRCTPELYAAALRLLGARPGPAGEADDAGESVTAVAFAQQAVRELDGYRAQLPEFEPNVQIREDVTGLMVSRGRLLIGERLLLSPRRVDALLQHEVGTHIVTFVNGASQPLQQLRYGLAGYDELQEGLAVLAEFLVGGLTRRRLRTLGARVVAVCSVESGAEFMDTFRLLRDEYGFSAGSAFDVSERVHASGGFTRDIIYLRGLLWLLGHLEEGGELEPLYIGKLAAAHTELIAELRERAVLRQPPLRPLFLDRPEVQARLKRLRGGSGMEQLLGEAA